MLVDNHLASREFPSGGDLLGRINGGRFDPGLYRPYLDKYDRPAVSILAGNTTLNRGEQTPIRQKVLIRDLAHNGMMMPVWNATSLRKEDWVEIDRSVTKAARLRMTAWNDLASRASYSGFDGWGKIMLETEAMSDPGEAVVDMSGITEGRTDSPLFSLQGLPLPITHCDFWFDDRRLAISRNSNTPLDTTMAEAAAARVGESVEKTLIGVNTGITYGAPYGGSYGYTSAVYGYTNHPNRITYTTITAPTAGGWAASTTINNILAMRDAMFARRFFGPFGVYLSNDWDLYLDRDYVLTGGNVATQTLRQRLEAIDGIEFVKRLDFLFAAAPNSAYGPGGEGFTATATSPFTVIMVQLTSNNVRAVTGMELTTLQWDTVGGMKRHWKVLTIKVPQIRSDYYSNTGILHATTA